MTSRVNKLNFQSLVSAIKHIHEKCATQAGKAVNVALTLRNWLIGGYIEEYERKGTDRAKYGERMMDSLADALKSLRLPRCDRRELYRYRQFYLTYPQIVEAVNPQLLHNIIGKKFTQAVLKSKSNNALANIVESATPQFAISGQKLLESLSFTHFAELIEISDHLKRSFYELECIRGNWSVRELKRQIGSLYYERSGLSKDKKKLAKLVQKGAETAEPKLAIRDPYVFEFLGIKSKEVMAESDLEDALLDKLHDFLLELGHGFCFEARQKRILIGNKPGYVDLVFYHRVLKCHVLIELKVAEFSHEHLGQLNTYVNWYRKNVMSEGDNLPIGILLCTQKDHALVEYALAGMDNRLFVSKYQLELPKKAEMEHFLEEQIKEIGYGG